MKTSFESFLESAIEKKHPRVIVELAYSVPMTLCFRERVFLTESSNEYQPEGEMKLYPKWPYGKINLN